MAASERLKRLIAQLPDPDSQGMYTTDIDKEKIERVTAEIHQGGEENVKGIVELLVPPGEGDDVKAHYALHCVANHVLKIKDAAARLKFSETLSGLLAADCPKAVKAYLCQELQWAGGKEAAAALGSLLTDEELVEPAAMALVAICEGTAPQFRAALPKTQGKCRLNILHALAQLVDPQSADAFRAALADPDREVRLTAGSALAQLGDPTATEVLLQAADRATGWERIKATKHCLVLAEKLTAAGKKDHAAKIYKHLVDTRTDRAEKYLHNLAAKALAAS